jgi:5-methylcytosine-specific restriction protein A
MPTKPKTYRAAQPPKSDEHRLSASKRGYGRAWQKRSMAHRRKNPLCVECKRKGLIVPGECVDHIIPHKGNRRLFEDDRNLQTLCNSCHSKKTTKEGAFGR